MSTVPRLHYSSADQPNHMGFETWRQLMSPMYDIRSAPSQKQHPGGRTVAYLLGNIIVNRTVFTAQRVVRGRKLAENTPDHLLFQYWRAGGYTGEIEGEPVRFGAGTVAFSDRRRTLDVNFLPADTLGLIVPRSVFAGLNIDERPVTFDPVRGRLLVARLTTLYGQLHRTELDQSDRLQRN